MMLVGAALGIDWDKVRASMTRADKPMDELTPMIGPTIAELQAQITPPRGMGSTLAASVAAIRRLVPKPDEVPPIFQ